MRPKRSLGQNFLVDPNLQRAIVRALDVQATDEVLEIGPGTGALTRHLVDLPRRLVLVELDRELADRLARELEGHPQVTLVQGDILDTDIAALAEDICALKVIGNIPYNRTSPIVFRLLERPRPAEIVVMVQKEVGERMLAAPGSRTYGALSVGVRVVARVERVLRVRRTAFRPVPRVDSVVVRIRPFHPPRASAAREKAVRVLTRAAFQRRRKQFQRILRDDPAYRLSRREVAQVETRSGLDLTRRPETFAPEDFVRLAKMLERT
ncbi:MAG: ribosomal RNA small subunit methyltransferase A [Gammaproteobacteria bacterium]|nr:ribosomal RNA small subunit methyltransferase A [Gammaproteobacteria bacterium]MYK69369.1 ribosomal RNA small subunit methyltransferase A [Gammaproteobacteria bacterium]